LKLTYNAAERWEELFQLYDEVLARAPDERARAAILEEAVETAKDLAGDVGRATDYLEQLIAIRRDPRMTATLERLYERHGKHQELIDLLSQQLAGSLEGETAQRQRARIAAAYIGGLGDAKAACDIIEQMLAVEPNRIDAFELLEKVVAVPEAKARA